MTINEKILILRKNKKISQAELAFKIDSSIDVIRSLETNGTGITGFLLLQILDVFDMTVEEFQNT